MPVYVLHGFRWPRPLIRIHIILHNLEDAAAEWLVAPATTDELLDNFDELMPDIMNRLPHLRFIEQYDPDDLSPSATSQPYAYVANQVEEVKLGVDLDDIRAAGVEQDQDEALTELRNKLAPEAKVAWYVVFCGDEQRIVLSSDDEGEEGVSHSEQENTSATVSAVEGHSTGEFVGVPNQSNSNESSSAVTETPNHKIEPKHVEASQPTLEPKPRGLSKIFGSYRGSKLSKKKSSIFSRFGDSAAQTAASNSPMPVAKRPQTAKD